MKWMKSLMGGALVLVTGASPLLARTDMHSVNDTPNPHEVTYCDLSKDPAAYNHELVRLTAFVTHGFEDFHLADSTCNTPGFSLWVMYGGKVESDTAYCCPGESGSRTRAEPLTIEGILIPLDDDDVFKGFTSLLTKEKDTTVRLTAVGRFFSGERQILNGKTSWGGAGHLDCCSLFVIQRVESFDPHTRTDLDYTSEAGWYEEQGCKFEALHYQKHVSLAFPDGEVEQAIAEQRTADTGEAAWRFTDPERVAIDSLKASYPGQAPVLKSVKKTSARQVFRWKSGKNKVKIVVTRPYWLSFYSTSGSVVWVTSMIEEAECR